MVKRLSLKKDGTTAEKSEFMTIVEKTMKTPIVPIKYCYLAKPFFYPGSHVPRYSVTLLFDKSNDEQKLFLEKLEKLASSHGVETLGYLTEAGFISIKFQTKDSVKIYAVEFGKKAPREIELEHDLPEGFKASVVFELNTYLNKKTQKNGFNFCPKKVVFHLDEEAQNSIEVDNDRNSKSSGNRSRTKNDGVRDSQLQSGEKRDMGKQLRTRKNPPKVQGN